MSESWLGPEDQAAWEAARPLIEGRGKIPQTLLRRFLRILAEKSNAALIKAEHTALASADTEWQAELRVLRFAYEKGAVAYIERMCHELQSGAGVITPANFLDAYQRSPTGSNGEVARLISDATGRTVTRQGVHKWRKENPHLDRPRK